MRLSTFFVAALPAFAMAQTPVESSVAPNTTTTVTHTTHLVKTISLSKVHTVTSCNTTSSWSAPTSVVPLPTPTNVPSTVPTDKGNGAGVLSSNLVLVGLAGVVAAML